MEKVMARRLSEAVRYRFAIQLRGPPAENPLAPYEMERTSVIVLRPIVHVAAPASRLLIAPVGAEARGRKLAARGGVKACCGPIERA